MSLGLIADDQGRRHHLPAPIHHLHLQKPAVLEQEKVRTSAQTLTDAKHCSTSKAVFTDSVAMDLSVRTL